MPNMGTINSDIENNLQPPSKREGAPSKYSSGVDALFSSTQQRLLALLFGQPERSFYARELIALTESGSGAVQRELAKLVQGGLLAVTSIGNQKHYQANSKSPVFPEIQGIVIKSFGITDKIRQALLTLESPISCAFIYGSVAKGGVHAGSDIDVMIVSNTMTLGDVFAVMQPLESQLGRKINSTLYTQDEFSRRKQSKNPFLTKVLSGTIIPLIGDLDAAS